MALQKHYKYTMNRPIHLSKVCILFVKEETYFNTVILSPCLHCLRTYVQLAIHSFMLCHVVIPGANRELVFLFYMYIYSASIQPLASREKLCICLYVLYQVPAIFMYQGASSQIVIYSFNASLIFVSPELHPESRSYYAFSL